MQLECLFLGFARAVAGLGLCVPALAGDQPTVRIHDQETRGARVTEPDSLGAGTAALGAGDPCGIMTRAWHNQPIPGGGTLNPVAFANPAAVSSSGRILFISLANGSLRNQGLFTADEQGLRPIVLGCGGGGGSGNPGSGCGDPTPLGGTFSGFFTGTVFTPATNQGGDALFMADVDGGSAPRGLFLYNAATQSIVSVAAVGDPSPLGGTFGSVGPGSMNDQGDVVFLAGNAAATVVHFFLWQGGTVTVVAAVGDPAPGGGTFQFLGSESFGFADGTSIPSGPVPDINNDGVITFRAIVTGGTTSRGIIVSQGGVHQWYVSAGDPTPAGGTYFDFFAPMINDSEQVAFFADFRPTPTTFNSGWFVGSPGSWRKAIVFFDPIGTGECFGLAVSRNPMRALDADGDLVFWTTVRFPNTSEQEQLLISSSEGNLITVARQGDPSPHGGTIGTMDAWPSHNEAGQGGLSSATPGAAGGILSAHMLFSTPPEAYCTGKTNSLGCIPFIMTTGKASATDVNPFLIEAIDVLPGQAGMLLYSFKKANLSFHGGKLCVKSPFTRLLPPRVAAATGTPPCTGVLSRNFNARIQSGADPLLTSGAIVYSQWLQRDPSDPAGFGDSLSNAVRFIVCP